MQRRKYDTSGFSDRTVGEARGDDDYTHSRSRNYSNLLTPRQLEASIWKMEQIVVRIECGNEHPQFEPYPYKRKVANNTSLRTFFNRMDSYLGRRRGVTYVVTDLHNSIVVDENSLIGSLRKSYGLKPKP